MTKKDFLAGIPFMGSSRIRQYKFEKQKGNPNVVGSISIRERENSYWEYYANVEKCNSVSVSIYFSGVFKIHKERLILNDLEKIGGEIEK